MYENIATWLKAKQPAELATCDGLQPRVRTMTLLVYQDRFWFATGSQDNKVRQLTANPMAEALISLKDGENGGYIRISGKMEPINGIALKKELADFSGYIYEYWSDPADPGYVLYELVPHTIRWMKPGEMLESDVHL